MESITNPLAPQIVYLDFDGENTIYHNEDLNISLDVNVEDSLMCDAQKYYILSQLDEMYDDSEVVFTLSRPDDEEYSTVYIGKTDAFNKYGSFAGLAETIDKGNQIKNDNAFVSADYTSDLDNVITVIDHELGHIVKGMEHNIVIGTLSDFAETDYDTYSFNTQLNANVEVSYSKKNGFQELRHRYYLDIPEGKYAKVTVTYNSHNHFGTAFFFQANFNAQPIQINDKFGDSKTAYFLPGGLNSLNYVETYLKTFPGSYIYYAGVNYDISITFHDRQYQSKIRMRSGHGYDTRMFDKYSIQDNQSLKVNFTVFNDGDVAYNATKAYIYDGSKLLGTVTINSGAAFDNHIGVKYSYTIPGGTLSAGTHEIRVVVDGASGYYSSKIAVTATPTPDLITTSLTIVSNKIETTDVEVDQTLQVVFTVRNDGNATAKASKIYLYDGNKQIGVADIGSLNANQEYTGSITFSASEFSVGKHTLKLQCDALNQVAEPVENNNSMETSLTIVPLKPDWGVQIENLSSKFFLSTDTITVKVEVTNHGKADAPAAKGVLRTKQKEITAFDIPALKAGETKTIACSFSASELPKGQAGLFAEVNTSGLLEKSIESNTSATIVCTDEKAGDVTFLNNGTISIRGGDGVYSNYHDYVTVNDSCLELSIAYYNPSQYNTNAVHGQFYLDGKLLQFGTFNTKDYFTIPHMTAGEGFFNDYTIELSQPLTQGWHKLKCVLNSDNSLAESNHDNNVFEYEFYVAGANETIEIPDLKPYALFEEPLILSHESGATKDDTYLFTDKDIYASFAVTDNNSSHLYSSYTLTLSVDGKVVNTWNDHVLLSYQTCDFLTDLNLGKLSIGTHVVELNVNCGSYYYDETGKKYRIAPIVESNMNNNVFTKTITVVEALADLVISSFTTSTDSINSKQSVTLNFSVKNQGDKFVSSSYVYIYDGDKYLDKVYIGNLDVGASLSKSYTIYSGILSEGAHNLKVVADGSAVVPETDENNNASAIKTVTVENLLADLIISSFTTSTDTITSKQSVTLNFSVKNQGDKFVSSSYVYIYDGDKYLDKVYIGNLDVGASLSKSYTIYSGILSEGAHNLKVVADGSIVVPESNENNNASAIKTVTVSNLADLVISSFTTSTDTITSKQSVTLNFSVKNQGDKFVSSSYVYIYDGDKYLDKVYIGNLDVGASLSKSYTIYSGILSEGAHNLKVVADGSIVVPESNENNNASAIKTVTVTTVASGNFPEIYMTGDFSGMLYLSPSGEMALATLQDVHEVSGAIDRNTWELLGTGDFNKSGSDGLLWQEKATGHIYMQNDFTSFAEVNNRTNHLGTITDGYKYLATGDFSGTGMDGIVMQGPAFGDSSVSLNYGLPIWGREANGSTFTGWLGALVNTWQPGQALKGNTANLADINAKNYMYEVVAVGDFNGDGVDDVMLQNIMPKTVNGVTITGSGDVFTFLTGDINAVKAGAAPTVAYAGCATDGWQIVGTGDFDGDGTDDVLLSDGNGIAGWSMYNGQRLNDFWFGTLSKDQVIIGTTDLDNNGKDDIIIRETTTNQLYYISC